MEQQDIWGLFPGAAGGRAVRDKRGVNYLNDLARKGGQETVKRYGIEHMRKLARKGGQAKRDKVYTQPATIEEWDGTIVRRVPWYPHQKARKRRKRPVLVKIELEGTEANVNHQ